MSPYGTSPDGYGTSGLRYPFDPKGPAAYLDYSERLDRSLVNPKTGDIDTLVNLSLAIKPSGELIASRLSFDSTKLSATWWLAGGVPGRDYTLNLEGTTEAGRNYQWPLGIRCDPALATGPRPPILNPGYGPPITWSFMPGFDLTNPLNSGYTLLLAGF